MVEQYPLDETSEDDIFSDEQPENLKVSFPAWNSITFKDIVSDVSMVRAKRFFPSGNTVFRAVASEGV